MTFAPVGLFVFRRPAHTRRMVASLMTNPEFNKSPIYVFADAARTNSEVSLVAETRSLVRAMLPDAIFVEAENNLGLARSIKLGVDQLTKKYGKAIVVEDDLLVSPDFLAFMNTGLEKYANENSIFQIAGYLPPTGDRFNMRAVALPFTISWGWGTWDRAWKDFDLKFSSAQSIISEKKLRKQFDLGGAYPFSRLLKKHMEGRIDSWAIAWYSYVFHKKAAAIYPPISRVTNDGLDGSGTHGALRASSEERIQKIAPPTFASAVLWPLTAEINSADMEVVCQAFRRTTSVTGTFRNIFINGVSYIWRLHVTKYLSKIFNKS